MISTKLGIKKIDKVERVEWVGIMKGILKIYDNVLNPSNIHEF